MRRFSLKIAENRWNRSGKFHTGQWLASSDYEAKDRRSIFVTKADQNRAKKSFIENVKETMEKHQNMSQKEAMDKVLHSTLFTSKETIEQENIAKAARDFGYRVKADGLRKINDSQWLITSGPHTGCLLSKENRPGCHPSYVIVIYGLTREEYFNYLDMI